MPKDTKKKVQVFTGTVERQSIDSTLVRRTPITLGDVKLDHGRPQWLTDLLFNRFANSKVKITIEVLE
ncbi:hypothetical protein LIS04_27 [Listeria phage LIS04]|nr:hypothetical protein LIS04_27 [Listeria phage LIS04]